MKLRQISEVPGNIKEWFKSWFVKKDLILAKRNLKKAQKVYGDILDRKFEHLEKRIMKSLSAEFDKNLFYQELNLQKSMIYCCSM